MAAQAAAAAISNPRSIFLMPWLERVIYGGQYALFDVETAPFVKEGVLREMGHVAGSTGTELSMEIKSFEFKSPDPTGVLYTEGKPIIERAPKFQLKIDAPSMRTLAYALLAGAPATYSQSAVSADTDVSIPTVVLDTSYYLGYLMITKVDAAISTDGSFTELTDGTDYIVDTSAGLIRFLSTGKCTPGADISVAIQAAAITANPRVPIGAVPRFVNGGLHIYTVVPPVGSKTAAELFKTYIPRCRIEPNGNIPITNEKPGEITLDVYGLPSPELGATMPYGYAFAQIEGTARIV